MQGMRSSLLVLFAGLLCACHGANSIGIGKSLSSHARGHDAQCWWACDDDEGSTDDGKPPPRHYECWGLLKVWCKDEHSSNYTRHYTGFGCQGHFAMWNFNDSDHEHSKVVTLCDGGRRFVEAHVITGPDRDDRYLHVHGDYSVGSHVDIMTFKNKDDGKDHSRASRSSEEAVAEAVLHTVEVAGGDTLQVVLQKLHQVQNTQQPSGSNARRNGNDDDDDSDDTFKAESRTTGLGGEWGIHRHLHAEEMTEGVSWETLEQQAAGMEHPGWQQWFHATSRMSHLNDATHGVSQSLHEDVPPDAQWTVLCNGKPAWFLGRLPCWGNLTVVAEYHSQDAEAADISVLSRRSLHANMQTSSMAGKSIRNPYDVVTAGQPGNEHCAWHAHAQAECDGLWTGDLGRSCIGITTSHSELMIDHDDDDDDREELGSLSWMPHSVRKWGVCSGRVYTKRFKLKDGWGRGSACRGTSANAIKVKP